MKPLHSCLFAAGITFGSVGTSWAQNVTLNLPYQLSPSYANTLVGPYAGNYSMTGVENSYLGNYAGNSTTTGNFNAIVGTYAGFNTTSGYNNVFVGARAGFSSLAGLHNVIIGDSAGFNNLASGNVFMGSRAGFATQTGAQNTFLGYQSGYSNAASGNTFVGYRSGMSNTAGQFNTFLGNQADAGAEGLVNATAVGSNTRVYVSNAVVLGNGANVGIGTSAPTARLHVNSGVRDKSGLRLEELNADDVVSRSTNKFLTVDGDGNVILATYANSGREAAVESLWQRSGRFLQSLNDDAVIIGQNVSKTPTGYRLYVQEGILTEKVRVAVKNTRDWSDYVFAPSYKLYSLAEVEQYIKANQHLPGLLSAKQMVEQGNDLHRTDAKLLEKIEELTLYSIQLEKENQQQQAVNRQQAEALQAIQQEQAQLKQLMQQVLSGFSKRK